ncbi:MAG: hypothetical protein ACK5U8_19245 [Deltaproteobacteria bacterium]
MKRSFSSVLEAALLSSALTAAGCGGNSSVDAGGQIDAEPGCPGCPAADAGCPGPGCPGSDAGCPGPGCPGPGCPGVDAGCPGPGCPGVDGGGSAAMVPPDPSMYDAFLRGDGFRTWMCDPAPQPPLPDSPHGRNVICVNPTLAAAIGGTGDWPVGSAAIKVTYDMAGAETGRYLDVRRTAETGAAGWYFLRSGGPGGSGTDMTTAGCVGCHSVGRDYVRRTPG